MTAARDMRHAPEAEQARVYLECLFGDAPRGYVELRAFPATRGRGRNVQEWFWHEDAEVRLLTRANEILDTHDIYVGCGLRRDDTGGSKADVELLCVLWADLDCAEGQHKGETRHATRGEAFKALRALPAPPTLVIDSGGGLHAYWRLADPLDVTSTDGRARAEQTMRRLAAAAGGDPAVCDVARILRLPGSQNRKQPEPRPVRTVFYDPEREYALEDLEERLPELPARTSPQLRPVDAMSPDERAERSRGRLYDRLFLPCMKNLAAGAGWQGGDGHAIRLRAAAHLKYYGIPEGAAPALVVDLDRSIAGDEGAEHDLVAVVESVYRGRGGEGYNGLGCEDDLWTAGGRRCGERERATCPIWAEHHEADAQRAALETLRQAHGAIAETIEGADLTLALRLVYDAIAALDPWPTTRDAAIAETVERYKKRAGGLTKSAVAKEVARRARQERRDEAAGPQVGPAGLVVPTGYRIRDGQLLRNSYDGEGNVVGAEVISDRPPLLVGRYRDIETDERQLECEFSDPDGSDGRRTSRITAPRKAWTTVQGVGQLADVGLPVHAFNARQLTAWLDACETANAQRLPYQHSTHRLGWHGDAFVLGDETLVDGGGSRVHFVPLGAGESKTAEALRVRGVEQEWERVVLGRALEYPRLLLCVVGAFAPAIMGPIDAPTFLLELVGESSTGKTTASRVAMSAWGAPEHPGISRTFWATDNSHERYLATIGQGLPGLLDDSQNAPKPEAAVALAYWIGNGQGKGRAAPNGTRVIASWRTVVFVTGEKRLDATSTTTGTAARIVSFEGSPFGGHVPAVIAELVDCTTQHHGHAGRRFVRWLLAQGNWRARVRNHYAKVVNRVRKRWPGDSVMARRLNYAATIITTAELLEQAFSWPLSGDSDLLATRVEEALSQWATEQPVRDQARESYESLLGWVQRNRTKFLAPGDAQVSPRELDRGERYGVWDATGGVVKVLAEAAQQWASAARYDISTSAAQWKRRGWLEAPAKGRDLTRRVRFEGVPLRCYVVRLPSREEGDEG